MQLFTPVALPPAPFRLTPVSRVLTLGSCFAQHIGQHIAAALPDGHALVNPFGPLYAPQVIAHHLRLLLDTAPLPDATYFEGVEGMWHNRWFSTHVSSPEFATCRRLTTDALSAARDLLRRADVLMLTLGTDRCYRLPDGRLVANCHKQPAATFTEHAADVETLTSDLRRALDSLRAPTGVAGGVDREPVSLRQIRTARFATGQGASAARRRCPLCHRRTVGLFPGLRTPARRTARLPLLRSRSAPPFRHGRRAHRRALRRLVLCARTPHVRARTRPPVARTSTSAFAPRKRRSPSISRKTPARGRTFQSEMGLFAILIVFSRHFSAHRPLASPTHRVCRRGE